MEGMCCPIYHCDQQEETTESAPAVETTITTLEVQPSTETTEKPVITTTQKTVEDIEKGTTSLPQETVTESDGVTTVQPVQTTSEEAVITTTMIAPR